MLLGVRLFRYAQWLDFMRRKFWLLARSPAWRARLGELYLGEVSLQEIVFGIKVLVLFIVSDAQDSLWNSSEHILAFN